MTQDNTDYDREMKRLQYIYDTAGEELADLCNGDYDLMFEIVGAVMNATIEFEEIEESRER